MLTHSLVVSNDEKIGNLYGWALSLIEMGQLQEAEKILKEASEQFEKAASKK